MCAMRVERIITGNYFDKYASRNPIHRRLVDGFLKSARSLLDLTAAKRVLEVGTAAGDLAGRLFLDWGVEATERRYCGIELGEEEVRAAHARWKGFSFLRGSVYSLPFSDQSFDLCVACEILEHLAEPREAVEEIARVTRDYLLASVPWEPVWRIMNLMRGKYMGSLGNTPGHCQQFSRQAARNLIGSRFRIIYERRPFPWTVILARRVY